MSTIELSRDDEDAKVPPELKGRLRRAPPRHPREPRAARRTRVHADRLARRHGGLARHAGARPADLRRGLHPDVRSAVRLQPLRGGVRPGRARVPRRASGRAPAGDGVGERAEAPADQDVPAHPRALDRGAVRGEARGVRRARHRRRRRAPAVHGVGRNRVDHLDRAGLRRDGPDALLLVAARARRPAAADPGPDRGLVDAGEALGGVQRRADARGRDALGGLRIRDGGRRRARVRAGRADARQGRARDRRAVQGRGPRALPRGHVLADVVDLLRGRAVDHHRARIVLRRVVGAAVRSGRGVPVPGRRLPARLHRPAGDLRRDADRDRRLAQDPGGPRHPDRGRRARARRAASRRCALGRCRRRALRLPGRAGGAARHRPVGSGRRPRGDRGGDRLWQDDVREAHDTARRSARRPVPDRRRRPARGRAGVAPGPDPDGAAGRVPVRHDDPRERPVRTRRRHRRRGRRRVRRARPLGVGRVVAGRARDAGRRAGRGAVGRRTAARGARRARR